MEFIVGVYAKLEDRWNNEEHRFAPHIKHDICTWCDDAGVAYYKKEGSILVCKRVVEMDDSLALTHEQLVLGMVEGLREKQTEIRAEAQMQVTVIDEKINKLLAITDQRVVEMEQPFAPFPRKGHSDDVTDVHSDDIPF